jgi:adenosylmethionine-8-amino-7-oxononanoate aminotransferase
MPPSLDDLKRWDKGHVWHAFTQMAEYEPLLIQSAHGCRWSIEGREFLDGVSGLGATSTGIGTYARRRDSPAT